MSSLQRQLDLSMPLADVEKEVEQRLKRLQRTVRMPGFRPGKVPFKMVTQQYGFSVHQEVMSDHVNRLFNDEVSKQNLRVAGLPQIEAKQGAGSPGLFEFTAKFEVFPEVVIKDLAQITIERPVTEVTEADVDHTINVMRKQRATFSEVDRLAIDGDLLNIDFVGRLGGEAFKGGDAKGFNLVLGEKQLLPDFEAGVHGMKKGETKIVDVAFPDDYQAEELRGKTAQFEINVNTISEPKLPELDATFAKALGVQSGDVATMRAEVKANMEREAKKRVAGRLKEQVMEALIANSVFDLPQTIVQREIASLERGAVEDLKQRGMDTSNMQLPADVFQEQAQRRVRLGLIVNDLVRRHELNAKPEQVRSTLDEHSQSFERPREMVNWYYSNPERLAEVEALVLEENVVNWVLGRANVQDRVTLFADLMGLKK